MSNKIGIMGGTFDPIHDGHIQLAKTAYEQYSLDEIWFMPSGDPPHKEGQHITPGNMRMDMVRLAMPAGFPFLASDFEIKRTGLTYTAETLHMLSQMFPGKKWYYIVGEDSLLYMEKWHTPEVIFQKAVILAAPRHARISDRLQAHMDWLRKTYCADIRLLDSPFIPVSSREIRQAVKAGDQYVPHVPDNVLKYIHNHHIYYV